jgi:hypothetical protein
MNVIYFLLFGGRLEIGCELVMLFQLTCDIMFCNFVVIVYSIKGLENVL